MSIFSNSCDSIYCIFEGVSCEDTNFYFQNMKIFVFTFNYLLNNTF